MADDLPALYLAISNRLGGDGTLTALLTAGNSTGIYVGEFPATGAGFHIVIDINDGDYEEAATFDGTQVVNTIEVHVYADRHPSGNINPWDRCATMLTQIRGDWESGAQTVGLDRWTPTLAGTSWGATKMRILSRGNAHDDEQLHFFMRFECITSIRSA